MCSDQGEVNVVVLIRLWHFLQRRGLLNSLLEERHNFSYFSLLFLYYIAVIYISIDIIAIHLFIDIIAVYSSLLSLLFLLLSLIYH